MKCGKLFYDTGELKYEGYLKPHNQLQEDIPYGEGIKYFQNGQKHMKGIFEDWFISEGKEYYENGNLRFEGTYNSGPRYYYGPRYFVKGQLYYETGELWFDGRFIIQKNGSMGYPSFKGSTSFACGTEYNKGGKIIRQSLCNS